MSVLARNSAEEIWIIELLIQSWLGAAVAKQVWDIKEKTRNVIEWIEHYQGERNHVSKIWHYVKQRVRKIFKVHEKKYPKEKKEKIYLTLYLQWVLKKFKEVWLDLSQCKRVLIPKWLRSEIHNILHYDALTSFFIAAKHLWILDTTENLTSTWEEERELKILNTSRWDVAVWLERWGSRDGSLKSKEWDEYFYVDDYQDTQYGSFEFQKVRKNSKRTFRIRKKTRVIDGKLDDTNTEYFYTIKREKDTVDIQRDDQDGSWDVSNKKDTIARTCYEKEFKILKYDIFTKVLRGIWFLQSRTKQKYRKSHEISFVFEWVSVEAKLDIDDYRDDEIPELLEIECSAYKKWNSKKQNRELTDRAIQYIIDNLGINKKERLVWGSKKLFKRYDKKYKNHYTKDEYWNLTWYNPNNPDEVIQTANINDAPELDKAA